MHRRRKRDFLEAPKRMKNKKSLSFCCWFSAPLFWCWLDYMVYFWQKKKIENRTRRSLNMCFNFFLLRSSVLGLLIFYLLPIIIFIIIVLHTLCCCCQSSSSPLSCLYFFPRLLLRSLSPSTDRFVCFFFILIVFFFGVLVVVQRVLSSVYFRVLGNKKKNT